MERTRTCRRRCPGSDHVAVGPSGWMGQDRCAPFTFSARLPRAWLPNVPFELRVGSHPLSLEPAPCGAAPHRFRNAHSGSDRTFPAYRITEPSPSKERIEVTTRLRNQRRGSPPGRSRQTRRKHGSTWQSHAERRFLVRCLATRNHSEACRRRKQQPTHRVSHPPTTLAPRWEHLTGQRPRANTSRDRTPILRPNHQEPASLQHVGRPLREHRRDRSMHWNSNRPIVRHADKSNHKTVTIGVERGMRGNETLDHTTLIRARAILNRDHLIETVITRLNDHIPPTISPNARSCCTPWSHVQPTIEGIGGTILITTVIIDIDIGFATTRCFHRRSIILRISHPTGVSAHSILRGRSLFLMHAGDIKGGGRSWQSGGHRQGNERDKAQCAALRVARGVR